MVVAVVPLNLTVLDPCVEPKFAPEIVIGIPTAPTVCERLLIVGVGLTVKVFPALDRPVFVTMTVAVPTLTPFGTVALIWVAFQLVGIAVMPLKVMLPMPWVGWK